MRSLTSIGGVSYSALAKQLAFIRDHPEVRRNTRARARTLLAWRGKYRATAVAARGSTLLHARRAAKVLDGNISRQRLGRAAQILGRVQGEDHEPEDDWSMLTLQEVLPFLCAESPNFRDALQEAVLESGRRHSQAL